MSSRRLVLHENYLCDSRVVIGRRHPRAAGSASRGFAIEPSEKMEINEEHYYLLFVVPPLHWSTPPVVVYSLYTLTCNTITVLYIMQRDNRNIPSTLSFRHSLESTFSCISDYLLSEKVKIKDEGHRGQNGI